MADRSIVWSRRSTFPDWDGLIVAAARVTRLTWHKDTMSGRWHPHQRDILLCVSDQKRQHWGIENRSHYARDVTFFEDHSRIRNKPGHFARFRTFALNILRANGTANVSRKLYLNALNPHHAISYRMT